MFLNALFFIRMTWYLTTVEFSHFFLQRSEEQMFLYFLLPKKLCFCVIFIVLMYFLNLF